MKEMAPWKYFPFRDAFFKNHSEKFPWEMTIRVTFDLVVDHFVKVKKPPETCPYVKLWSGTKKQVRCPKESFASFRGLLGGAAF